MNLIWLNKISIKSIKIIQRLILVNRPLAFNEDVRPGFCFDRSLLLEELLDGVAEVAASEFVKAVGIESLVGVWDPSVEESRL